MKSNRWFYSLVLAVILVGFTGWLGAQGAPEGSRRGGGPGCDMGRGLGGPGGHGDGHRLLHLLQNATELDVTDEQIEQIEAVFENASPQFEALTEQLRTEREAWHEACDPAVFDEVAARQFAEAQAAIHADLMVLKMQTHAEVLSYLTLEQRDALEEMRGRMGGRFGGKGHHGRHR